MNSGRNDMEQWLQQSAEMGSAHFEEGDWEHMKQLLQPEKKRRFLVFWWLLGLLVGVGVICFLLMENGKGHPKRMAQEREESKQGIKQKESDNQSLDFQEGLVNKQARSIKKQREEIEVVDSLAYPVKEQERYSNDGIDSAAIRHSTIRTTRDKKSVVQSRIKQEQQQTLKGNGQFTAKKKKRIAFKKITGNRQISKVITPTSSYNKGMEMFIDSIERSNSNKSSIAEQYKPFELGQLAKINFNLPSFFTERKMDSTAKVNYPNDSSTAKKQEQKKKQKSEWLLGAGYYVGKVPVKSNGISIKLMYSFPIKHFSINPSLAIHQFHPTEQQQHDAITKVTPNPGTTFTLVNTKQTIFKPANGITVSPALSIGYKVKKWNISIGASKSFLFNGNNKTIKTRDTFSFYAAPLPASVKVTPPYDASSFNGKQSVTADIGLRYSIRKRWHIGINYMQQFWYNKLEGIVDEKKKRTALAFYLGIRL